MCAIPLWPFFVWKRATWGAPWVMWPINQFDHSIFVSNVTFQMGINTGEVDCMCAPENQTFIYRNDIVHGSKIWLWLWRKDLPANWSLLDNSIWSLPRWRGRDWIFEKEIGYSCGHICPLREDGDWEFWDCGSCENQQGRFAGRHPREVLGTKHRI